MTQRRILQIIHRDEIGGVKTLADMVREAFAAEGDTVETACLFPPHPATVWGKLRGMGRVARRLRHGRYDAVIAYQSTACLVAGVAGRLAGVPRRVAHQTALPSEVKRPLRWLDRIVGSLGFYTDNVLNSHATWAAFSRYPRPYRAGMSLIEHGVEIPHPRRGRAETLAGLAIADDGPVLLNVGRMAGQKNQAVLIRALTHLPGARLVVAGDGPLGEALAALAADTGVADRVHLLGDVDRGTVGDLLGACDVFVFPSVWETFGLAAVEASMAGVPVVASDLPVLREVLADCGVPVRFVDRDDAGGWARATETLLSSGAGARATRPGDSRYSVRRMAAAYVALLGSAGDRRAAEPAVGRLAGQDAAPAQDWVRQAR